MYIHIYIYVYKCKAPYICLKLHLHMVFTTEGFFEVAIESGPEWDLNLRPLNCFQTL